jgi:hypothetical protein
MRRFAILAFATLLLLLIAPGRDAGAQSRQRLDVAGIAFGASFAEVSKVAGMRKAIQIKTKDDRLLNTLHREGVRLYGEDWHITYIFGTGDRLTRAFASLAEDSSRFSAAECSRRGEALLAQMTRAHGAPRPQQRRKPGCRRTAATTTSSSRMAIRSSWVI